MEEIGEVVALKNDLAIVRFKRSAACEKCGACKLAGADFMEAEVKNLALAEIGDKVLIELEPKILLTASLIVYIVPVVFLILGYFLGAWLANVFGQANVAEPIGIVFGFGLFALSYFAIREIDRRLASGQQFYPAIKRIVR